MNHFAAFLFCATAAVAVPQSDLALWNAEEKWIVEPGAYTVWVGDSSQATLTAKFNLEPGPRSPK